MTFDTGEQRKGSARKERGGGHYPFAFNTLLLSHP